MTTPDNFHNVPKGQWRKWNDRQRGAFNYVYQLMEDQRLFTHPKAVQQTDEHWNTTRWNAAWVAADAAGRL